MNHLRRLLAAPLAAFACVHADAQSAGLASNAAVFKACAAAPKTQGACPLDAVFGLFTLAAAAQSFR